MRRTRKTNSAPATLMRRLGPLDAAAIVVANVIGVGIFTTPGIVASMVPHPVALLSVWIAGGLLAFAGAMAYAELAARFPRAGGEYVYLHESYGPAMAFLSGWTSFVAGFSGAIAAAGVGCATFIGRLYPAAGDATPLAVLSAGPLALSISPRALVAIGIVLTISAIHVRGVEAGKLLQNTLTVTKVGALLLLTIAGLAIGRGTVGHLVAGGDVSMRSWATAMIPVMFSYSGWNAATYVAEEVRDPGRNVPRALALGTVVVSLVYVGLNAVYVLALPRAAFVGVNAGEAAFAQLLGGWAGTAFTAVTIVIILSSISAMILAGPRVYYAMARDGVFFAGAAQVHPRFRTPHVAIAAQAAWAAVLVLSGTFEQLLMYTGFAVVLFAAIAVASLFVVRRRDGADAAFTAYGYPVAPLVFCGASLLIVANAVREQPLVALTGIAIMLSGVPLYAWLRARGAAAESAAPDAPAVARSPALTTRS